MTRSCPVARRCRLDAGDVDPGRDHLRCRHPAGRVVAADDLGAGLLAVGELHRGLAADVGAEVVHDGLLVREAECRELERARQEGEPEDEVEDVGLREQAGERAPLDRLAPDEAARAVEVDVGLGVERVALEDDEPGIDPATAKGLGDRPRHARRVDRAEGDAEGTVAAGAAQGRSVGGGRGVDAGVDVGGGRAVGPGVDVGVAGRPLAVRAAHRWRNRPEAGTFPMQTRDGRPRPVPVPPGGWGLGMGPGTCAVDPLPAGIDFAAAARAARLTRPTRAGRSSGVPSAPGGSVSAMPRARRP